MIDDNPQWGETLEQFLDEIGIREEVYDAAVKRVISWQLKAARGARVSEGPSLSD